MKDVSVIALYLPQFHQIPENDKWWGNGFTEWTAVKNAKSLYQGHRQPVVPLNNKYYNLLDKSTMLWQAELIKKYSIKGMAFYHYWFKDGRKILEKPAENLLAWQDVDMPFCLNWANETWARTWSNLVDKNVWTNTFENKGNIYDNGILLDQKYGNEKEWLEHIKYLLPFFKDPRYICKDGKPVFLIYRPDEIACLPDMKECWERYLMKHNLPGIYLIGGIASLDNIGVKFNDVLDAVYPLMPRFIFDIMKPTKYENGVALYSIDEYWKYLDDINLDCALNNISVYTCVVNGYDDTPRHGVAGHVLPKLSVEEFTKKFETIVQKTRQAGGGIIFYNAWNEWGEGMYLEPDKDTKFTYLEAMKKVLADSSSEGKRELPRKYSNNILCDVIKNLGKKEHRDRHGMKAVVKWMELCKCGKNIAQYIYALGYKNIAIYGYGYLGRLLFEDLRNSCVHVDYVIDKSLNLTIEGCKVYSLNDKLPAVDGIIVTPSGQYWDIRHEICAKTQIPAVSLEHIIFEC